MVKSKSTSLEARVAKLEEILKIKRELEKEEKEIKEELRDKMGAEVTMQVGIFLILISQRKRKDLDKEKVRSLLGAEYANYEKETEYSILEVKRS